jgi:hypothetical protein
MTKKRKEELDKALKQQTQRKLFIEQMEQRRKQ